MAKNRLFCFGLGYSALHLAQKLKAEGWHVAGTCRGADKRADLRDRGIAAHLFDGESSMGEAGRSDLKQAGYVLSSVPPAAAGDPALAHHGRDLTGHSGLAWAGYLSTTGVYGDHDGGWVDEDTPIDPDTARGDKRARAEGQWRDLYAAAGLPVHIFRLAGIYGPGRNLLVQLREGRARRIAKPGQVFSRIHVDDIARVVQASMARPDPGAVYNVCDDEPAPSSDVTAYAARLLGMEPPPEIPFEEADLSPMARSFYRDNKRVRNDKIKRDLGVALAYPTYREGLAALHAAGEGS